MNKKIADIIKQADNICSETHGVFDEILIQMVVEESIKILETQKMGDDKIGERYFDRETVNHTIRACQIKLKHHFGVEE